MIYFNNGELDYNPDTLYKLVVKRALTDIEKMIDRKGTSSTQFKVPRTANNERLLGFISVDGSIAEPIGEGRIMVDNNIYSQGTIYVKGYTDTDFDLLFMGQDVEFVKSITNLKVKDLIDNSSGIDAFTSLSDAVLVDSLGEITISPQGLDHYIGNPYNKRLADNPTLPTIQAYNYSAPLFKVKNIINKIVESKGYILQSDILNEEYFNHLLYCNFSGQHQQSTTLSNETTTVTTLRQEVGMGNVLVGNGLFRATTPNENAYIINPSIGEDVKIFFKAKASTDVKVKEQRIYLTFYDNNDNAIFTTNKELLNTNYTEFNTTYEKIANTGIYFICYVQTTLLDGQSLPISFDATVSNVISRAGNAQHGNLALLQDYLGDWTQLEFLQNFLKHYNLILDIQDNIIIIEPQDKCNTPIDNTALSGIATKNIDISNLVKKNTDITFEYDTKNAIYLKQTYVKSTQADGAQIIPFTDFGSKLITLNSFGGEIESYATDFNTAFCLSEIELFGDNTVNITTYSENEWENLLCLAYGTTAVLIEGLYESSPPLDKYETRFDPDLYRYLKDDDTVINTVPVMVFTMPFARLKYLADNVFLNTLKQRKDKKIKEIELYDHQGTLMNFRTDYIINNQVYKLISFQFEPISKKVIAQIILK